MSNPVPSSLALTTIGAGAPILSADHRNNYSAVQTAVNAIITALTGGVSGQMFQAAGSTSVGWVYAGGMYRKATVKDVVSTAAETDLLNGEITIGANVMGTTGAVRVTMLCDYLNNTGGNRNLTLKVKLGGTTLFGDAWTALSTSVTRRAFHIQFTIANQNSAAIQFLAGTVGASSATAGSVAGLGHLNDGVQGSSFSGSATEDTTTSKALTVTATHSASDAALSVRLQHATVEVI